MLLSATVSNQNEELNCYFSQDRDFQQVLELEQDLNLKILQW